ncbi:NAD(P)H-dependent oxidoreductase [Marinomonas posidonica]|uniref:Nitroreductase n=1 Tax=Marinomonas posidonica (strain CECT 7376 / NCIMB 14433 / IVIA-Po-181) TaxID=491952 RepID=F6CSW8_MARPP|nr:NAD(P)H-dependent oxidoreductase [Marinomonas posidonica]AEF53958.1 nitroreductase [Marinomonas posidonica IVIA-Po-181]
MSIIGALKWRHSLKHFSPKKVDTTLIHNLIEAARLSASSYGLQPYQLLIVQDPALLQQLSDQAFGQAQVKECSHLFIFANKTNITDTLVEEYFEHHHQQTQTEVGSLNGYAEHIKTAIGAKTEEEKHIWAEQQAYIALGSLLAEAAMLSVDTCPMTGFDKAAFNHTLGLTKKDLSACVICAVGYRDENIQIQNKVRLPLNEFASFI